MSNLAESGCNTVDSGLLWGLNKHRVNEPEPVHDMSGLSNARNADQGATNMFSNPITKTTNGYAASGIRARSIWRSPQIEKLAIIEISILVDINKRRMWLHNDLPGR